MSTCVCRLGLASGGFWGIFGAVMHSKSERIDVRARTPVKQLLQEAARVAHKNVSEFLLDAGITASNQTLADRTRFALSDEKWLAFQAALDQRCERQAQAQEAFV